MTVNSIDTLIIDSLTDCIYCVDKDMSIIRWNRAMEIITGLRTENVVDQGCRNHLLCHLRDEEGALCDSQCHLTSTLRDGQTRSVSVFIRNRDARQIPVIARTIPIYENGSLVAATAILSPYAETAGRERNDMLDSLTAISVTDRLTGLYNRRYFAGEIGARITNRKDENRRTAISIINIDNFNALNNTFGHDTGDAILRRTAKALQSSFRKTDIFCRLNGEAFAALHDFAGGYDLEEIGKKMKTAITGIELKQAGQTFKVTASIGVTELTTGDTVESVIQRLEGLRDNSKKNGTNQYSIG